MNNELFRTELLESLIILIPVLSFGLLYVLRYNIKKKGKSSLLLDKILDSNKDGKVTLEDLAENLVDSKPMIPRIVDNLIESPHTDENSSSSISYSEESYQSHTDTIIRKKLQQYASDELEATKGDNYEKLSNKQNNEK